jgi:hypothetical protein
MLLLQHPRARPDDETQILSVPVRLRRAGREIRMLIDGTDPFAAAKPDVRLIKLLLRARQFNRHSPTATLCPLLRLPSRSRRQEPALAKAGDDQRDAHVPGDSLRTDRDAFRRLSNDEPVIVKLRPGFLTHEDKIPRETDSSLEGERFEPSVPRQRTLFETAPFELAFPMGRERDRGFESLFLHRRVWLREF